MVELSVQIETAGGLDWPRWKQLCAKIEELGFAGLFRCDHFTSPSGGYPDSLETITSLTYLADHSRHVHFGPLVTPVSFRNPIIYAWQAVCLDNLSGGRMVMGIGAGWMEREHRMFGFDLGDVSTRMDRLGEALEVVTRLLRSDEPVSFEGRFYRLHETILTPRPERSGGPPLLVGGSGPKRTLPLVARYAGIWNTMSPSPERFRESSSLLDELLQREGREPGDVKRTLMTMVLCGRNERELGRLLDGVSSSSDSSSLPLRERIDRLRARSGAIVGTPDEVLEQIHAYEQAGVQEIMAQQFALDDELGLEILAEEVLPRLRIPL